MAIGFPRILSACIIGFVQDGLCHNIDFEL